MMKLSSKLKFLYNFIFLFIFIINVKGQYVTITLRKSDIQIINIDNSKIRIDNEQTSQISKNRIGFLINILTIDCEFNITNVQENVTKEISHYDYKATSIFLLNKGHNFFIEPLIHSKNKEQYRKCPLIINRIDIDKSIIPELNINGNEPVFLYFNDFLKQIKLVYNYDKKNNMEHPIIISFFIQEKKKFKIQISDEEKSITSRYINYKENIIIKPIQGKTYNIFITPEEGIINSTMIVKIIQNNSYPFYLQKNQLNLGFLPIGVDYYYYYMQVFKGEEGEIMLFNKKQNGILISKFNIITEYKIPEVSNFPKYNEAELISNNTNKFNIYNQKLSFNSSQTEKCTRGCFLLITYYSNISKSLEINGTEFSLLSRIWDKNELISQIIDIPLNEYIFGSYDQTAINIHYYSIFIPYETDDIYIEIHGMNILGYTQNGITKINTTNMSNNIKKLFDKCEDKMVIKLNKKDIGLNSFKGKYISFAFEKNINDIHSYYYFRILQQNPEIHYMIYPLDTNKENICETQNNICYFLLKNEYNDLSNKIVLYGFGNNDISYKVFDMNDSDYYSTDLKVENLNEIKEIENSNGLLSINLSKKFILVEINSNSNLNQSEILTVISYSLTQPILSSFNIYSYQLYHLSENAFQQYDLIQNPLTDYRILINNTKGEGNICFNKIFDNNDNFIHLSEQKIYSFSISNKTNLFIHSNNNLIYHIKIIYGISNKAIKELNYQYNLEIIDSSQEKFPLIYFIKDIKYNGININFIFKFDDSNNIYNSLTINGYGVDYSEIFSIKDKKDIKMLNFANKIDGKFDNITNIGTIELSTNLMKTKYKETYKYLDDKYFMIIIENNNLFDFKNLRNDIYVFSKDENKIILPINKYIRNSYNLFENKNIIQKYYFEKENIINNEFLLEFSSNYENIEIIFNNITKQKTPNIFGGFKQYSLSISSDNAKDYYFTVVIKTANQLNSKYSLKEVNIIIKYYNEDQKINTDYIWDKKFELNETNNTGKYSDYNLIIKNKNEISNTSNDLNYIYYLRLIKKSNILANEILNTTALVSSNLLYINHYITNEINKDFNFELINLKNNENYTASFFIKVKNPKNGEENYYSMTYDFYTDNKENEKSSPDEKDDKEDDKEDDKDDEEDDNKENEDINNIIEENKNKDIITYFIIILIFIIVLIIIVILFFIVLRRIKLKNKDNIDNIQNINFSLADFNDENIINDSTENSNDNNEYEHLFV